jgi:hypothetical protein
MQANSTRSQNSVVQMVVSAGLPGASHGMADECGYLGLPGMKSMAFIDSEIRTEERGVALALRRRRQPESRDSWSVIYRRL